MRRLQQEKGLHRLALRNQARGKARLHWQAERPGALWHAHVRHGAAVVIDNRSRLGRIRGILDNASRCATALESAAVFVSVIADRQGAVIERRPRRFSAVGPQHC